MNVAVWCNSIVSLSLIAVLVLIILPPYDTNVRFKIGEKMKKVSSFRCCFLPFSASSSNWVNTKRIEGSKLEKSAHCLSILFFCCFCLLRWKFGAMYKAAGMELRLIGWLGWGATMNAWFFGVELWFIATAYLTVASF